MVDSGRRGSGDETADGPGAVGSPASPAPLRPRALVERGIRTSILAGDLAPGDRLPSEFELATAYGVSRTTVREALRALTALSLIRKVPGAGGGSFVQPVDIGSFGRSLSQSIHRLAQLGGAPFEEMSLMRQFLEIPAVRLAAVNRSDAELATLQSLVDEEKRISVDDPRVSEADAEFHGTIAAASGNRLLASFVQALHLDTEPVHYLRLSPQVGRTTVGQHQRIVRAISDRDVDEAERAMTGHLSYLRAQYSARIESSPSGDNR
jgi:GntR family transcriptional regulator, transcriptional repressor for pyruvate dehydrogenase complex